VRGRRGQAHQRSEIELRRAPAARNRRLRAEMTAATMSSTPVPVPEQIWSVDTGMGKFMPDNRAPGDRSAFTHWQAAGCLFVSPSNDRPDQFDQMLARIEPGDPVFAYEHGAGIVAIGRVCSPKRLIETAGLTALYPWAGTITQALVVDWDTSVTRTAKQVWDVTNLGGLLLKSAGPGTKFFPMAIAMLQEAHDRHLADPDFFEAASLERVAASPAYTPRMRTSIGQSRIGQGVFGAAVMAREPICRLTGVSLPRCLVASHIKPWAVCIGGEHLDGANGLMLAPHVDFLFDTGLISFTDNGRIILAPALDRTVLRAWHIDEDQDVGSFSPDQARYLAYHRAHVTGQPRARSQRNVVGDTFAGAIDIDNAMRPLTVTPGVL